jgi:23S rRNA pseudouridine2605 synthase
MRKSPAGQRQRSAAQGRPSQPANAASTQRIAKALARAGLCSRREAERWIGEGRVSVNGEVLATPARDVGPDDRILVDGKALPQPEPPRLWRYHKPKGLVTSHSDPQHRPTVFAALPAHLPRVISVGRLDFNTEGLLLLTNDGGLARYLELPATGWLRRYRVRAHGNIAQEALENLKRGIEIDGMRYGPIEAALDKVQGSNVWITIGLREGKNREVRSVLDSLGLKVNRLIRVSFGPFQLLDLESGAVEAVRQRVLIDQLGRRVATQLGLEDGERKR